MKILITGSTGMVGRNLAENPTIEAYDLLLPRRSELDLSSYKATLEYINVNQPDLIIHAAGKVGGITANISEPSDFLISNIDIGRNLILAAKEGRVKKLLNIGSSCIYPRNIKNPLKEEYLLQGEFEPTNEGYAIAKVFAMKLCEYIEREDSTYSYKTIIPCNLYGKYDKFDSHNSHLIPSVIQRIHDAMKNGIDTINIWGDGTARREFMYTGDFADFVAYSLQRYSALPAVMNIGLGYDHSINKYYQIIANILGYSGNFKHDLSKPTGIKRKLVDIVKLEKYGWHHKTRIVDGIRTTYEYYLESVL